MKITMTELVEASKNLNKETEKLIASIKNEEKQKWITAIECAECDDFVMRVKDHNKKIFKYYDGL